MQKAKTDMTCGYNISEWESADVSANYLHHPERFRERDIKKKAVARKAKPGDSGEPASDSLTPPWARKANALFEELLHQSVPCDLHNSADIGSTLRVSLSTCVINIWDKAPDSGDGGETLTALQPEGHQISTQPLFCFASCFLLFFPNLLFLQIIL